MKAVRLVVERAAVRMSVFDTRGRLVFTLLSESVAAGSYRLPWLGTDAAGHSVASGVYHVRLEVGSERFSKRLTLLR